MAQKLEEIKRDEGSIRVGSTGTISSLMNKELDSYRPPSSSSSKTNPRSEPVSMSGTASIFKLRKSMDEPENTRLQSRQRHIPVMGLTTPKRMHRVPMLVSENMAVEKTPPKREKKPARKICMFEVVDSNCGVPSGSLSNRLKKLSFSKLSHSII